MMELDFSRWNLKNYMLRQDEISGIVEILNSINTGISGSTLIIPDTYSFFASRLTELDWTRSDNFPVAPSGQVSYSNLYILLIANNMDLEYY